jgi:lipid-binding SYLF domain-containing protein
MKSVFVVVLVAAVLAAGCSGPKGATVAEKKSYIQDMRQKALSDLYAKDPSLKAHVEKASGYGVFSNIGTNIIFITTGSGYGVVKNNKTGKDTYMKMAEGGVGLGLGVKDFRAVFVFNNEQVLNKFIYSGWEFGAEAEAAAKSGEKGGAANVEGSLGEAIEVYQLTETGVALQANVAGTKYWLADEFNR